jgi:RNA polymerase sigma-70 factor (ECF subfamily)
VVQDVMLAIWQSAPRFRAGGSVAAWLTGIARHRAIDATRTHCSRARAREQALDAAGPEPSGDEDDQADALTLHHVLASALDQLSPKQREGIALAYYAGLTHDEIAQRLGKPLGTVKSRIHLGLVQLRRIVNTADW